MALSDEVDALYGLPLDAFTAARNDLARRLRTERRREEAAEVAALRKPSAAAWVVNQLARGRPEEVRALLAAADEIRTGAEDGDARFREAVDRLARGAREILAASGRASPDQVVQEVVTTLRAIAANDPEALEAGRLTEGREASGFDALAGTVPKRSSRRREKRGSAKEEARRPSVDRAAVDAARKALADARTEARDLGRAAAAAEREAERARVAHERAETRVAEARAELDAARGAAQATARRQAR